MPQKYNIVEDKNAEGIFSYAIFKNGETEPTHKHWSVYGETYNQFCERISDDVAEETQGEHLIGITPDVNPAGESFGRGTRTTKGDVEFNAGVGTNVGGDIFDKAWEQYRLGGSSMDFQEWLMKNPVGMAYLPSIAKEIERMKTQKNDIAGLGTKVANIPNNYAGKSAAQVWDAWDASQRRHFVNDHSNYPTDEHDMLRIVNQKSNEIQPAMLALVEEHISTGQYGTGTRVAPAMANAFRTDRHYLKPGNIINEKKGDTVLYCYEIVGFKADPTENVMVVVKEHSHTPGKPAPEFAIALSRMITSLTDGLYTIEGLPIETDLAKALLRADAEIVEKELMCEAVHAYVKEQDEELVTHEMDKRRHETSSNVLSESLRNVNRELETLRSENATLRNEGDTLVKIVGGAKDTISGMEALHGKGGHVNDKGTRVKYDAPTKHNGTGRMIPKSITKVKNFYHVTLKPTKGVPKNIKKCTTPEWAATIADAVHSGAKITMCSDGTNWWPQTILLPAKGEGRVIKRNAKIVANKILGKLTPTATK